MQFVMRFTRQPYGGFTRPRRQRRPQGIDARKGKGEETAIVLLRRPLVGFPVYRLYEQVIRPNRVVPDYSYRFLVLV